MPTSAPYGYALGLSPTLGDDEEEALVPDAAATPTSDWASLVRAGYRVVRGVLIEGIPYAFGERALYTVTGSTAQAPTADYTVSAALMTTEGDAVSVEVDRQTGLASGRALDITLRRDSLTDEGLLATLFTSPSWRARLSSAVTDPAATSFPATVSSSVAASGFGYIGRELIRFTSTDATHIDGITRGVCGWPHYHRSSAASGYSEVTDVPTYWIGRFVTEFEHLCSPEGRYLGDKWCSVGTYCRESWKGYIDELPKDTTAGKVLRCLPLVRIGARKIGAKITGKPARDAEGNPKLYWTATDTIQLRRGTAPGVVASGPVTFNDTISNLRGWSAMVLAGLGSGWSVLPGPASVAFWYTGLPTVVARPGAWFLTTDGQFVGTYLGGVVLPVSFNASSTAWLCVLIDSTEDATIEDVPERGLVRITVGQQTEIAAYDGTHRDTPPTGLYGAPIIALRLVQRGIGGSPKVDPWTSADAASVAIVSGYQGSWAESFRAIATSSGLGVRGVYDSLGFGFGLGVPEEWIDLDSLAVDPMASTWVDATSADDTTLQDCLCGWLALWGKCLIQKRNSAGKIVLSVVDTTIAADTSATTLTTSDVLLGGHAVPELATPPNIIEVDTGEDSPKVIPRDRSRMNAEGDRRWTLRATGAQSADIAGWASSLLTLGDGQTTQEVELLPGTAIEVGDARSITTAHPLTYDTAAGAYAPASIDARCVAVEVSRWTEIVRARFLLSGGAPASTVLAPAARVLRAYPGSPTDTVEVKDGHEARFAAGYKVYLYEPGTEGTRKQAMTVSTVSTSPSRIQMTTTLPSWVNADSVVTYDDVVTCVAAQQVYMFVRASKYWKG